MMDLKSAHSVSQRSEINTVMSDLTGQIYFRMVAQTGSGSMRVRKQFNNLIDFDKALPDEAACIAYFRAIRWPDGIACVHCGSMERGQMPPNPTRASAKSRSAIRSKSTPTLRKSDRTTRDQGLEMPGPSQEGIVRAS